MRAKARDAWQKLYSKHGLQYGGTGELGQLANLLRPEMIVLDAGCGDGKTAEVMIGKCEVVGCDFSRDALLSLRAQRDRDGKANLVECDISYIPFCSEKFDVITCIHTLSHMLERERAQAARELERSLKRGGHIMIEGFGRTDLRYGAGQEMEPASFMRGNGILTHYFDEGEIPRLFPGLKVVSESHSVRRVLFGAVAGRRSAVRVLMTKP